MCRDDFFNTFGPPVIVRSEASPPLYLVFYSGRYWTTRINRDSDILLHREPLCCCHGRLILRFVVFYPDLE